MAYHPNHLRGARSRQPRPSAANRRTPGVVCHAFPALDGWYVVSEAGIWTIQPDHDALLAWCIAHVRSRTHDSVIIHHDAPVEPT